jgi:hypothetical protein
VFDGRQKMRKKDEIKKVDERKKQILKTNSKSFDKRSQRAELLRRNRKFLKKLKETLEELGDGFFTARNLDNEIAYEKYGYNVMDMIEVSATWSCFCELWGIQEKWNGKIDTLSLFQISPVVLYHPGERIEKITPILIGINEWTTIEDIRAVWEKVEKLQNDIWGKRTIRANFSRDLCWYDLNNECNLKASEIAKLWNEKFPEDIDKLVLRNFRKRILVEDLRGRVLDDMNSVKEIRDGYLSKKYKADFEEERNDYITGELKTERGIRKIPSPFVDVIKKATKRMEKEIKKLDTYPDSILTASRIESE